MLGVEKSLSDYESVGVIFKLRSLLVVYGRACTIPQLGLVLLPDDGLVVRNWCIDFALSFHLLLILSDVILGFEAVAALRLLLVLAWFWARLIARAIIIGASRVVFRLLIVTGKVLCVVLTSELIICPVSLPWIVVVLIVLCPVVLLLPGSCLLIVIAFVVGLAFAERLIAGFKSVTLMHVLVCVISLNRVSCRLALVVEIRLLVTLILVGLVMEVLMLLHTEWLAVLERRVVGA